MSGNCYSYFACKNPRSLPGFANHWLPSFFLILAEAEDAQPYADICASSQKQDLTDAYILQNKLKLKK